MSTPDKSFDVIVLGGGSGGYATALRSAQLGAKVALIEADELGGTCLHRGCVPTKALLHAAEAADAAKHGDMIGILSTFHGVDMARTNQFKEQIVSRLHTGLQGLIKAGGITVFRGRGVLNTATSVSVGGEVLVGDHLVLATGSVAQTIPGVELSSRVIVSDDALRLEHVPKRVVIIGGSVIGVEFASLWRSFGAEVTVIEALPSLVPLEDPSMGRLLERSFRDRGIKVHTGCKVVQLTEDNAAVTVSVDDGRRLEADVALVAVGRTPATSGIDLERHGIVLDQGFVKTDERLRTSVPNVRAVGDIVKGLQLAHRGFAHGIFVAEDIAGLEPDPVLDNGIPRVTYSNPEIASVGLTQPAAEAAYGEVETYEYHLAGNGKSQILDTTGVVKLVRKADGPIVGVHMIGARMGEQVGEAALIVNWEAFPEDVARFIHAHPTQNESMGEAAMALAGKPLHVH